MVRVAILVEGQTEEQFVKQLLEPYFLGINIFVTPIILKTKRISSGADFRGGMITFSKVEKELKNLINSFDFVSTMFDYYGLDKDFPVIKNLKILKMYMLKQK